MSVWVLPRESSALQCPVLQNAQKAKLVEYVEKKFRIPVRRGWK